jgi:hypothetical protein
MKKIQFSFEVPTAHLDDFNEYQDFHLVLSHLCLNNDYIDFYKSESELGLKSIWLDNGFNENKKADEVHDMLWAYREIKAVKLFSPDDLNWSFTQILNSYDSVVRHISNKCVIPVLKNRTYYDLFASKRTTTIISVPFRKRPDGVDPEWTTGQLAALCEHEWVHYLGLNSIQELNVVRPISCDTSMPIKLAIIGTSTYAWMEQGCYKVHRSTISGDFFDYKLSDKQIEQAIININQLKEAVNG